MKRRRWLAPEVVQTSEMDCGPACLKSLIDGFGGHVSYGRLREACQTDVDGTSIDTLEDIGAALGLECEQVLVAPDEVLSPEQGHLPCLAVVRLPEGEPHFVVLWRRHGPLVQVMDPGFGRRWIGARRVEEELYVHALELPASAWRAWAGGAAFVRPLARRLRALGVRDAARRIEEALANPGWRALATLDAVARLAAELVACGAVARARAAGLVGGLLAEAAAGDAAALVPERFWMARASRVDATEGELLVVRGAILVRARAYAAAAARGSLPRELACALAERPMRPLRTLFGTLHGGGRAAALVVLLGVAFAAAGLTFEALLLRGALDVGLSLRLPEQRLAAMGAFLVFLLALLLLEVPLAALVQSLARRVETSLRLECLRKLPRIELRYFKSRPASDMAERAHAVHRLRDVVVLGAHGWRALVEVAAVTAGLLWLAPESPVLVLALAAACVVPPLLMQKPLLERDLRVRTHGGSLSRFHLDALLGAVPVAAHRTGRALLREHEARLVQWARAARSSVSAATWFAALQALLVHGLAVWLVIAHVTRQRDPGGALLLVLWVMTLVWLAEPMAALARAYPTLRNVTLRLLEPLGAAEDDAGPPAAPGAPVLAGVRIEIAGATAQAGGHAVLSEVTLSLAPGEHVAVVGESGAGKSSLCGLLLGWQRATEGSVRIDGRELAGEALATLRQETAWIDPEVQLWNRSLAENVRYGSGSGGAALGELCEAADLHALLPRLVDGLATPLGESGRLVSGGEGQRVRLARALGREAARLALLDEPFRGLDRVQRQRLLDGARGRFRDATLLYVTHKIAEARQFERVLVIEGGRVLEDGVPRALAEDPSSRFHALLERERACAELWEDAAWRRLRLENGRLQERGRCAAV